MLKEQRAAMRSDQDAHCRNTVDHAYSCVAGLEAADSGLHEGSRLQAAGRQGLREALPLHRGALPV